MPTTQDVKELVVGKVILGESRDLIDIEGVLLRVLGKDDVLSSIVRKIYYNLVNPRNSSYPHGFVADPNDQSKFV